jgi:hypothetical protein
MAAETPFGLSFADPRRYMGKSPLAEIGNAAKTFLTGYAIQESGLEKFLNEKGMKKNPQGGYSYNVPAGSVPPATPTPTTAVQPPQQFLAPMLPQAVPPAQQGVVINPIPDSNLPPPDIGEQILNGTWTGFPPAPTGPTSLKNPTDFNPLAPDASNQFAVSGNDYQQAPGYGKLQKIASQLMGMG